MLSRFRDSALISTTKITEFKPVIFKEIILIINELKKNGFNQEMLTFVLVFTMPLSYQKEYFTFSYSYSPL